MASENIWKDLDAGLAKLVNDVRAQAPELSEIEFRAAITGFIFGITLKSAISHGCERAALESITKQALEEAYADYQKQTRELANQSGPNTPRAGQDPNTGTCGTCDGAGCNYCEGTGRAP